MRKALLIGVPEYEEEAIPNLSFIPNDIARLQDSLESSGYHVESLGIGPRKATGNTIKKSVELFFASAPEGATLLVCISGHGVHLNNKDYFMPCDAFIGARDMAEYLVLIDFGIHIENSKAESIFIFVDACREGIEWGTLSSTFYSRWTNGKLKKIRSKKSGYIFSCQPGEFSRYVTGKDSFSVFSRSLSTVIHKDYSASNFGEVFEKLASEMNSLSKTYKIPIQHIRLKGEFGQSGDQLTDHNSTIICDCPGESQNELRNKSSWVDFFLGHPLWKYIEDGFSSEISTFQESCRNLVFLCHKEWQKANNEMKEAPWFDEEYPLRIIEIIAFLLKLNEETLKISPSEVVNLLLAPFISEGIFASGLLKAIPSAPLDLEIKQGSGNISYEIFKVRQTLPHLLRKIKKFDSLGLDSERMAITSWILNLSLSKLQELWIPPPQGFISEAIWSEIEEIETNASGLVNEAVNSMRIIELARCIFSDSERIDRLDRNNALSSEVIIRAGKYNEQSIREVLLAFLLSLGGKMALDVRGCPEVILDHFGQSDPLLPQEVIKAYKSAVWYPEANGRTLQIRCNHPALDVALNQEVDRAQEVLFRILEKVYKKEDSFETLKNIPNRLTGNEIQPIQSEIGLPAYQKPHLQFRLSRYEIKELLMGEQLYGDPKLAIRELYQNALDACRYRKARTNYLLQNGGIKESKWEPRISFLQGIENGRSFIECHDNGVGMSRREITYAFSRAGKRFADMPEFIEEKYEWLKSRPPIHFFPNSQFGIGVFSYFMIADEIRVETCRVDRNGNLGEGLEVSISGSGSLFRIRPIITQEIKPGTKIRLYLNENGNAFSCRQALEKILYVSEFPTFLSDDLGQKVWIPGELEELNKSGDHILDAKCENQKVWWVTYSKGTMNGYFLADGIKTNKRTSCFIINLKEKNKPVLSVDRKSIINYDKIYAQKLLIKHFPLLISNPNWITYYWILALEKIDFRVAAKLLNQLKIKYPKMGVLLHEGDKKIYRLQKLGCCHYDFELLGLIKSPKPKVPDRSITRIRRSIPEPILRMRVVALKKAGVEFPEWFQVNFPFSDHVYKDYVNSEPGDAFLFSRIKIDSPNGLEISPGELLELSSSSGFGVTKTLKHFSKYIQFGLSLPNRINLESVRTKVTQSSIKFASPNLKVVPPFFQNHIPLGHLWFCSLKLKKKIDEIYSKVDPMRFLGYNLPKLDSAILNSGSIGEKELRLLSQNLDGCFPWVKERISISHFLYVCLKMEESVSRIYQRFQSIGKLGFEIPQIDKSILQNYVLREEDLLLLSKNMNGEYPLFHDMIPIYHIRSVSSYRQISLSLLEHRATKLKELGITFN